MTNFLKPVSVHDNLKNRTKQFSLDVIQFSLSCTKTPESGVIFRQLVRAATSVGANYRSACRAKSRADFLSKLCIVEEEADESGFWLELLQELPQFGLASPELNRLANEASQLVAIMVSSKKTARSHADQ